MKSFSVPLRRKKSDSLLWVAINPFKWEEEEEEEEGKVIEFPNFQVEKWKIEQTRLKIDWKIRKGRRGIIPV